MLALKIPRKLAVARSPEWPKIRRQHLEREPQCMACETKKQLAVHHKIPVHIDRSKELEPTNLITLCESLDGTRYCHFIFGHLGISWWKYDPSIVDNAAMRRHSLLSAKG